MVDSSADHTILFLVRSCLPGPEIGPRSDGQIASVSRGCCWGEVLITRFHEIPTAQSFFIFVVPMHAHTMQHPLGSIPGSVRGARPKRVEIWTCIPGSCFLPGSRVLANSSALPIVSDRVRNVPGYRQKRGLPALYR